ncbi:hypothetical protein CL632_01595 [bacterium]|jgi:CRP-like cAMP-binding protein|nr:hypothetical protein [bacterium]MDP6571398.1 cyclic nucleotide-binding domain-containing protein [Patescibacteria group bacterium]|tara:strand:- start:1785 stop:2738 length:954 start_codon:yes stop_codon:yes gene_type:complete
MTSNELQSIALFSSFSSDQIKNIEPLLVEQEYHASRTVYASGEPSENLYIIASGSVVITHELDDDIVTLARLEEGYFFGERGLLQEKQKHSSEARAEVDKTKILKLPKDNFEKLKKEHPETALIILEQVARVLSERLTEDTTRIAIISAISDLINDPDNLKDIKTLSREILAITLRAIPVHQAFLGVYKKHEASQLEILASIGTTPKELPNTLPIDSDPYLNKLHLENGEIVLNSAQYKDKEKVFYAKRNLLGRAITVEGENIGSIALADKNSGEFTNQNRLLLQIIAGQISFALEEARLRQEKTAQEELKREYVGI